MLFHRTGTIVACSVHSYRKKVKSMNNNYPPQSKNTRQIPSAENTNVSPQTTIETPPPHFQSGGYDPYTQNMVHSGNSKIGIVILIIFLLIVFLSVAVFAGYLVYDKISSQTDESIVNETKNTELDKLNEELAKKEAEILEAEMKRKTEELKLKEEELKRKQEELAKLQQQQAQSKTTYDSSYNVYKSNATWSQAYSSSGGRLVSIDSAEEFNKVCNLASSNGMVVFWVSPASSYVKWYPGEPSYTNENGEYEDCLMVFKVNGSWYFNDSVNDVSKYYSGKMGYITE